MEAKTNIIKGQKINNVKLERAKEFRSNMTEAESLLWEKLRRNQLGGFHFRRQQIIEGFIVDFYCDKARLIVEVDGLVHKSTVSRDRDREQLLTGIGLRILRIKNVEIKSNITRVLEKIIASCTDFEPTEDCGYPTPE